MDWLEIEGQDWSEIEGRNPIPTAGVDSGTLVVALPGRGWGLPLSHGTGGGKKRQIMTQPPQAIGIESKRPVLIYVP